MAVRRLIVVSECQNSQAKLTSKIHQQNSQAKLTSKIHKQKLTIQTRQQNSPTNHASHTDIIVCWRLNGGLLCRNASRSSEIKLLEIKRAHTELNLILISAETMPPMSSPGYRGQCRFRLWISEALFMRFLQRFSSEALLKGFTQTLFSKVLLKGSTQKLPSKSLASRSWQAVRDAGHW